MSTSPITSKTSGMQTANTVNSVIRDVQAMQTVQVFKDTTGTRRIILGRLPDGDYGLVVSKEGVDVQSVFG